MKLDQILTEMPLPSDWDKEELSHDKAFTKRLKYAMDRAKKVGQGSSRVAFLIEYEGRNTILKIAKNKKGLAQNEFESQMLNDHYIEELNITIPMIDYDENDREPIWIHTEFAQKMKPNKFRQFFNGYTSDQIRTMVMYYTGKKHINLDDETQEKWDSLYEDNEYFYGLVNLIGNYDVPVNDYTHLSNWGIYQNRPVIVDVGLSSDIFYTMYNAPRTY